MKKFSKMKQRKERVKKDEVIFSNDYIQLIKYEDWTLVNDSDIVICIPYLIETNQIILRNEYIPTYKYVDGQEYHVTLVGGCIEDNETPEEAIVRELKEEAGIVLNDNYKVEMLKPLYISKGSINKFYPCIIPINEREYEEIIPPTDGSIVEKKSKSVKVDAKYIDSINASDLITEYMLGKMKEYLNNTL